LQKEIADLDKVMLEMKEKRINIDENKRLENELAEAEVELERLTTKYSELTLVNTNHEEEIELVKSEIYQIELELKQFKEDTKKNSNQSHQEEDKLDEEINEQQNEEMFKI